MTPRDRTVIGLCQLPLRRLLGLGLVLLICTASPACSMPQPAAAQSSGARGHAASPTAATAPVHTSERGTSDHPLDTRPLPAETAAPNAAATPEASLPANALPPDIVPGELTRVPVKRYRAAYVAHAGGHITRALVYLHGVCGQVAKIEDWITAASAHATVIAVLGDKPCPTNGRFAWSQDVQLIHLLIERALVATQAARQGRLEIEQVAVFGYSQGATRAERLAALHPERYRWVVLGGPPSPPHFERLHQAERLVLLAGSEEPLSYLSDQAVKFTALGLPTRYDEFKGVGHGAFGASAPVVMTDALRWLFKTD